MTNRPELASNQALVQAALTLLRQEKLRPLMPSLFLRGYSTPASGTLATGYMAAGTNGSLGSFQPRGDIDVQLLWQLDNLGFGNRAKINLRDACAPGGRPGTFPRPGPRGGGRHSDLRGGQTERRRVGVAHREVELAVDTYAKNMVGLGQTRRAGDLVQTVIRPQEALASVQALAQAWSSYYLAVADSNRAQFRLYRALGNPAQCLNITPVGPGTAGTNAAESKTAPPASVPANPPPASR